MPDFHASVADLRAEGDTVVARWSWQGTVPGGASQTATRITSFRIAAGQVVETWAEGQPFDVPASPPALVRSEAVGDLLRAFYVAANRGDTDVLAGQVAPHVGVLGIGSDPAEWWAGAAAVMRAMQTQVAEMHAAGMRFTPGAVEAYAAGRVGWVADQPQVQLADGSAVPMRVTAVALQEGGRWQWVQFHAAVGVRNEDAVGQHLTI